VNKYAALGLLVDAAEGKRVAVILPDWMDVREALAPFRSRLDLAASVEARVSLINGAERITLRGAGEVRFYILRNARTLRTKLRGVPFDVVFIDAEADRRLPDQEREETWDILKASAATGEIVQA
jgi:hypothetical protein